MTFEKHKNDVQLDCVCVEEGNKAFYTFGISREAEHFLEEQIEIYMSNLYLHEEGVSVMS